MFYFIICPLLWLIVPSDEPDWGIPSQEILYARVYGEAHGIVASSHYTMV